MLRTCGRRLIVVTASVTAMALLGAGAASAQAIGGSPAATNSPTATTTAPEIKPGDPREKVIELLGPPQGQVGSAHRETLIYERAEICLSDGIVSEVDLRPAGMKRIEDQGANPQQLPPEPVRPEPKQGQPAPLAKIPMRILYAGHPDSDREKDFVAFLGKYFTQVETGDLATFSDKSANGFDVAILDYDGGGKDAFSFPRPKLPQNYARATVTVGVAGAMICSQLRLKTGYE
jgi:hypothetical protein